MDVDTELEVSIERETDLPNSNRFDKSTSEELQVSYRFYQEIFL